MAPIVFYFFAFLSLSIGLTCAISDCGGPCESLNDCSGQLICINGKCNDDPDVGTHSCSTSGGGGGGGGSDECRQSGTLTCENRPYPKYYCSPPVTSSTPAILTNNNFEEGGDGGGASECDEMFHKNSEPVVALSTGWFAGKSRCGQMIRITSDKTGRSTTAKVVDECDSKMGCDKEHAGQPPCRYNIVDASNAVWNALGLDTESGEEGITWSTN